MNFWELLSRQLNRVDFKHVIAFIVVVFTFWMFMVVMFYPLTASADKYASQIITGLISTEGMVLGFWFISSSVHKAQDTAVTKNLPLTWLGNFDSAPGNPAINDAYINITDNLNYYWDGKSWITTTQKPK